MNLNVVDTICFILLSPSHIKLRIKNQRTNSVELVEVTHYESPHLDLCCLQIQLFFFCFVFGALT